MHSGSILLNKYLLIFFLITPLLFVACSNSDSPVEPALQYRGQIISVEAGLVYPLSLIQANFTNYTEGIETGLTPLYNVESYKVKYVTVDAKGNLVKASGAIYIPKGQNNLSLVSFQHGTVTANKQAPSQNLLINAIESLVSASLGYFAIEPDYLGLGESTNFHPYLHEKTSADAIIDFIKAAHELAKTKSVTLNNQVFLAGYSEGGYVTLAAQKEIEKNYRGEINLTAVAPMAGPYDINLTIRTVLQNGAYGEPAFIAFLFNAYNQIYGWNKMSYVFNSNYASIIPSLFDGSKTSSEINNELTSDLTKLFNTDFIEAYLNGKETTIIDNFSSNSLLDWTPVAPIRFYHGNSDEYVPYQNSEMALNTFKANGANVELVTINGGTHVSSAVVCIAGAVKWFENFKLNKVLANR